MKPPFSGPTLNLLGVIEQSRAQVHDLSLNDLRAAIQSEDGAAEALEEALSQLQRCVQQLRSACRGMQRGALKMKKTETFPTKSSPSVRQSSGIRSKINPAKAFIHPKKIWARTVLGVNEFTPVTDIRRRYHELLKATHPDTRNEMHPNELPRVTLEEVREAWSILREDAGSDPGDSRSV